MTEEHRWTAGIDVAMLVASPPTPDIWGFVKGKLGGLSSFPGEVVLRSVASKCKLEGKSDSDRMDEIDIFITVALAAGGSWQLLLLLLCVGVRVCACVCVRVPLYL